MTRESSEIVAFRLYKDVRLGITTILLRRADGNREIIELDSLKGPSTSSLSWEEYARELERRGEPNKRYIKSNS